MILADDGHRLFAANFTQDVLFAERARRKAEEAPVNLFKIVRAGESDLHQHFRIVNRTRG